MDSQVSGAARRNGRLVIPQGYCSYLSLRDTQEAIKRIHDCFEPALARELNLIRVSAPIIVPARTGVNDHLSGTETPVGFDMVEIGERAEIVQSLAKWKRMALGDYGFRHGEGLYTDMNALRPSECPDNLHSIYVDQWDWERVISREERNLDFLRSIVRRIYAAVRDTERALCDRYPQLPAPYLPEEITFVHSEELEALYPDLSRQEREDAICRRYGAVFLIGIGAPLRNGEPHDARAADYDDWSVETLPGRRGLNGDILVWYPLLERSFELSSMGIRVDEQSLVRQLEIKGELRKLDYPFHRRLLQGELPLTIGGGIGQSRLSMLILRKAFIGEVQASVWPEGMLQRCRECGIIVL